MPTNTILFVFPKKHSNLYVRLYKWASFASLLNSSTQRTRHAAKPAYLERGNTSGRDRNERQCLQNPLSLQITEVAPLFLFHVPCSTSSSQMEHYIYERKVEERRVLSQRRRTARKLESCDRNLFPDE